MTPERPDALPQPGRATPTREVTTARAAAFRSPEFFRCLAVWIRCHEGVLPAPHGLWGQALWRAARRRDWRDLAKRALEHISFEELQRGLRGRGVELVAASDEAEDAKGGTLRVDRIGK